MDRTLSSCRELLVELPDGQSLTALVNGELGWLMYLRWPGDAGFTSRNPEYVGPEAAEIAYLLSNGQVDHYPAAWALPVELVNEAIEHFQARAEPPPFVVWHDESGNGDPPRPNNSSKPTPLRGAA